MGQASDRARSGGLASLLPIAGWLPTYDRAWFPLDLVAGLTLWGLLVPEAMAYAGIAGLPPQAGLYTLVASLLIYALFGTSRHLSVGATSATAALLGSSVVAAMAATGADKSDMAAYQAYAAAFVLVVGIVFLVAGLARLGFITQFLSKPVMDGFVVGLAGFVLAGQLYKLFGVEKPHGSAAEKFVATIRELPDANAATLAVGVIALFLLFALPRLSKRLPAGLVVLFAAIIASAALDLSGTYGVEVVGTLPQGLPHVAVTPVPLAAYGAMIVPAIGVLLVAFSEALGVGHEFAEKHGYEIDPDAELKAHALSNLASGLVGGMLAAGGMSGSAVKEGAGAQSQVANLVTWAATLVTLLFFTPVFATLPEAVLGAMIIHAIWHIIAARKLIKLRQHAPVEVWFGVATMAGVLFIDVLPGMLIGLLASLLFIVYRTSRPHVASLGRVPDEPGAYYDLARHPDAIPVPGVLIARLDAQLYYANALTFRDAVMRMVAEAPTPPRAVIFDAGSQDDLDITSADMLAGLARQLREKQIEFCLAEVHAPVRDAVHMTGLYREVGDDRLFVTIDSAVGFVSTRPPRSDVDSGEDS